MIILSAITLWGTLKVLLIAGGLVLSTLYLTWSWTAKLIVEQHSVATLETMQLDQAPRFSVPTPFNTLLWRVVVKVPDGYLVGYRSVIADRGPMEFIRYESDDTAINNASGIEAVARLRWFSRDFLKSEVRDESLILSDIRMGLEPDSYVFSFVAARQNSPTWRAIEPERVESIRDFGRLGDIWARIWNQNHNSYASSIDQPEHLPGTIFGTSNNASTSCENGCLGLQQAAERFTTQDASKPYVF